ncbi:hypothetical protein [Streptomyces sp. CoH27]|uniref:hypothetical protein n=1 Tax=Streptomyces sp. CoH27 TaxID=2875763 RepID=UPI001CD685F4|nr:hypothetical protein [Streptomyces sp. CoH27]
MIGWGGSCAAPRQLPPHPDTRPDADAFGEGCRITAAVKIGNAEVLRDGRYEFSCRRGSRPAFAPARSGWSSPRRP